MKIMVFDFDKKDYAYFEYGVCFEYGKLLTNQSFEDVTKILDESSFVVWKRMIFDLQTEAK